MPDTGIAGLPISILDIIVIVVLLISALIASALGFVRTLLLFGAWAIALYAAFRTWPIVQAWEAVPPLFANFTSSKLLAQVITIVAVFTGVLVVFWILGYFLSKLVRNSPLRGLDKVLGLLFGLGLGGAVLCLAYLIVAWGVPEDDRPAWFTNARTLPYLEAGGDYIRSLLPPSVLPQTPPEQGAPAEPSAGYNEQERGVLNRLIQGSQQQGNP